MDNLMKMTLNGKTFNSKGTRATGDKKPKPPKPPIGVCAECREDIYSMNRIIEAKDGALFHGRCCNV